VKANPQKCQISTLRVVFTIFSDGCNSPFPLSMMVNVLPNQPREKNWLGRQAMKTE
jgi:hypothetical protein